MKMLFVALLASICFTSCKKEEDKPQNAVVTIKNYRDSILQVKIYSEFGGRSDLDTTRLSIAPKDTMKIIWSGSETGHMYKAKGEGALVMMVLPTNKRYGVAYFSAGRFNNPPYNRFVFSIYKDSVLSGGIVQTPIPAVRGQ